MDEVGSPPQRSIELEGGSNFRDLGGYKTDDGRSTRWRLLFRSGALGNLSAADLRVLDSLGVARILDLRCREERDLTPGRWSTPEVHAIDYETELVFAKALGSESLDLYAAFPRLLGPHLGWIFESTRNGAAPIVVHCSGGQDRTGVVSAILLAALGVPKAQIVDDYMLTTALRRRKNEVDLERVASMAGTNSVAAFFTRIIEERGTEALDPRPLLDANGRPKVLLAFDAIDQQWGSLDGYLADVCGLDSQALAEVRHGCLE